MIRLQKGTVPAILAKNAAQWMNAIVDRKARGEEPTRAEAGRYRHPAIKAALVAETAGKCAYCESKIRHIAYGDVEHIVPKSTDVSYWFDWDNLTLACDICNTNKGEHPLPGEPFINPYATDPESEFWFYGPLILARPGNDAAIFVELILQLNRPDLVEKRSERLIYLAKILEIIKRVDDAKTKELLKKDFMKEMMPNTEYTALSREFIELARRKGFL